MKNGSCRRNRRNPEVGTKEEDSWSKNMEEAAWRKHKGSTPGKPLGTSLEAGMASGGHELLWTKKCSKSLQITTNEFKTDHFACTAEG